MRIIVGICLLAGAAAATAQESTDVPPGPEFEGPIAALEFEQSYRDPNSGSDWIPIPFDECENITKLTKDFWSKKHILTDFKKHRTDDQIGVIVFVKTEYCCDDSRLCAVMTSCMEKKSTPLVGRFRVYAGWIKNNPDHPYKEWRKWDRKVIDEYDFRQGPGARIVVMVPTWDGKMYEWSNTASDLEMARWQIEASEGQTPELAKFLEEAVRCAPPKPAAPDYWAVD